MAALLENHLDRQSAVRMYIVTFGFLLLVAFAQVVYVAGSPVPLDLSYTPLFVAIPWIAFGSYYVFGRFQFPVAALFSASGVVFLLGAGGFASASLVFYSGRGFPLVDDSLAKFDRFIGFDWLGYMQWFDQHPQFNALAQIAYNSIFVQPAAMIIILALTCQAARLYGLLAAMTLALIVATVIVLFLPALGAYEFFGVTAADHPHIVLDQQSVWTTPIRWLRAADFSVPMPPAAGGLISFPSYHAATAVIYIWALWSTALLRWIGLGLNLLMLIATPVHGSHYLVDVIAGIAIAILCIRVTEWALRRATSHSGRRAARSNAMEPAGAVPAAMSSMAADSGT